MKLGLTFDAQTDPADLRQAEFDPPGTIDALCQAFKTLGHEVVWLGNASNLLVSSQWPPTVDLVFNIAEGTHGRCREAWVPTLLELQGIPYVGSDALALSLGLDKVASKRLAIASGISTPAWLVIDAASRIPSMIPLPFPVIVKPRYEGSGIGIDEGAVVWDHSTLVQRVQTLCERWQEPILVEAFIPHGELTVCVIGNDPPLAYPAIQRPIDSATRLAYHVVTQSARRWETPLELSDTLDAQARRIALTMFEALGCRDVARVDLRVDDQGQLFFLEINPLPSFDPDGSVGLLAEHLGITYTQLIGRILEAAQRRIAARTTISDENLPPVSRKRL